MNVCITKPIKGFPGYWVNSYGRVWSEKSKKWIKKQGKTWNLWKNGKKYSLSLEELETLIDENWKHPEQDEDWFKKDFIGKLFKHFGKFVAQDEGEEWIDAFIRWADTQEGGLKDNE